jgi:hypothetical protein
MVRPERPPCRQLALALLIAAAGGCGGSPDPEKELDALRSWTASVRLAAEQRRADATSASYAAHLREKAARALADGRRTLATATRSPADHEKARSAADSLERAIRQLDGVADR